MNTIVGIDKADVTPQRPCRMNGYNRSELSNGVLDPIQVNSLALTYSNESFVLCVVDSIMISPEFAQAARDEISRRCVIPAENITVCCIHTHSGPAFFKLAFEDTPAEGELTAALLTSTIESACRAWETRRPATPTMERVEIEGLYGNRNIKFGPEDKSCTVITFTADDGTAVGKLLNISTHPTILNGKSLVLSADLIGQLRLRLEDAWGCPVVCTNGTCGDVSTRFYRQGEGQPELMRTADELTRQVLNGLAPVALTSGEGTRASGVIRMPTVFDARTDEDWKRMTEAIEADPTAPTYPFYSARQQLKLAMSPINLTLVAHFAIFGNVIVITMPGDTLSSFGLKLKQAFPGFEVIVIGYANTYCNYLVPEEEYGKYFETFNSRTPRGACDRFVERIIGTIKSFL
ncbi:hypothetical protein H6A22_04815 [Collinsella intestinalis]|nr:hypothetical protein [Collinsella intestinalis]